MIPARAFAAFLAALRNLFQSSDLTDGIDDSLILWITTFEI